MCYDGFGEISPQAEFLKIEYFESEECEMKENFIRITTNHKMQHLQTESPGLDWYYDKIGCTSIEIVRIGKRCKHVMVVDEEGLMNGSEPNHIATMIAGQPIFGNVLLCKEDLRNGEPDIVGFNPYEARAAMLAIHCIITDNGDFTLKRGDTE